MNVIGVGIAIATSLIGGGLLMLAHHRWGLTGGGAAGLVAGAIAIIAAAILLSQVGGSNSDPPTTTTGGGPVTERTKPMKPQPPRDTDGDGVEDRVDQCDDVWAETPNGCPPSAGLERLESENRVDYVGESAVHSDEVLLKGHPPVAGISMGIGTAYDDATVALQANGEYGVLRGKVGLDPSTCPGEYVTAAVRDEYGDALWKGELTFDPVPLHIGIVGVGRVALYAQATGESSASCYIDGSTVGWSGIRLLGTQ